MPGYFKSVQTTETARVNTQYESKYMVKEDVYGRVLRKQSHSNILISSMFIIAKNGFLFLIYTPRIKVSNSNAIETRIFTSSQLLIHTPSTKDEHIIHVHAAIRSGSRVASEQCILNTVQELYIMISDLCGVNRGVDVDTRSIKMFQYKTVVLGFSHPAVSCIYTGKNMSERQII